MTTELRHNERLDEFATRVSGVTELTELSEQMRQLVWDNRIAGESIYFNNPFDPNNIPALNVRAPIPFMYAEPTTSVQRTKDLFRLTGSQITSDGNIIAPVA